MTHHPEKILARIEQGLRFFELPTIEPMQGDQWLLASAMQKAIRRGEVNTAMRAGYTLWNIDRQRFWRRLHIVALEDTGVADTESLIQTHRNRPTLLAKEIWGFTGRFVPDPISLPECEDEDG